MNREFLPEAVLGVTIGLLVVVLAVFRTQKPLSGGAARRAGALALLTYAVIAAPVLVRTGMTWLGLLVLLVLLAGALWIGTGPLANAPSAPWLQAMVSVGLMAAMLIAAAQTISIVSILDPRVIVIVLAVVVTLLIAAQDASQRIGSLAMWFLLIPVLIVVALAALLGTPGQIVTRIIEVPGMSWPQIIGLLLAILVLARVDAGLIRTGQAAVFAWAGGTVLVIGLGMLAFFGGAVVAPTMQFFVVPANIDALPGLAGLLIAVLTVLFSGLVAAQLRGIQSARPATRIVALGAGVAVLIALLDPGLDAVVVATSLLAAVVVTGRSETGLRAGAAIAVVGALTLAVLGELRFGWWSALAAVLVLGVAALGSRTATRQAAVG